MEDCPLTNLEQIIDQSSSHNCDTSRLIQYQTHIEDDVISEALNINIPILFEAESSAIDFENRIERVCRIRNEIRKKFNNYGLKDICDSVDSCGYSISFPDDYDESKIVNIILLTTFGKLWDDYLNNSVYMDFKNSENNDHIQRKPLKLSKVLIIKIWCKTLWMFVKSKVSLYQWWLEIKSGYKQNTQLISKKENDESLCFESFDKYVDYRRVDFGMDCINLMIQFSLRINFSRKMYNNEMHKRLKLIYLDISWQLNDLHTFRKEFVQNKHQVNAITVLKNVNDISWQKAVDMLAEIIRKNYVDFNECCEQIIESDLDIPICYLDSMKDSIICSDYLFKNCKRYDIPDQNLMK